MIDLDRCTRLAELSDIPQMLKLINLIQPHVPWTEEILRWQFFDGPGGPSLVYIAEADSRIIAQYVAVPYHIWSGEGRQAKAWMIQDVMTHPDFRGQGILHGLGKRCLDEIKKRNDFGFTFPNEKSAGSFRRNGWHRLGSVPLREIEIDKDGPTEVEILKEVDSVGELVIPKPPTSLGVIRSTDYLAWRYSKPGQKYSLYRVGDDGFAVLKKYTGDDCVRLHICDLIVDNREQLENVLKEVLSVARQQQCDKVTAWLFASHPHADEYCKVGLALADELPVSIYVTGPEKEAEQITCASNWHITHGDSDVY